MPNRSVPPPATPVGHLTVMDEIKTKKVTFSTGLPRGACATFTHNGQRWFAYPQDKVQGLGVVMDRTIGTVSRLRDGLIDWINRHPEDAVRVTRLLSSVATAQQLASDKAEAWTNGAINEDSTPKAEEASEADT